MLAEVQTFYPLRWKKVNWVNVLALFLWVHPSSLLGNQREVSEITRWTLFWSLFLCNTEYALFSLEDFPFYSKAKQENFPTVIFCFTDQSVKIGHTWFSYQQWHWMLFLKSRNENFFHLIFLEQEMAYLLMFVTLLHLITLAMLFIATMEKVTSVIRTWCTF